MVKGNIVATYKFPYCTVRICDSAFAGKSREEKEDVRREAQRLAGRYYRKAMEREMAPLLASRMRESEAQAAAEKVLQARIRAAEYRRNMLVWNRPEGRDVEVL